MAECSRKLAWENKTSPRTCAICNKGPCRGGPGGRPWEVGGGGSSSGGGSGSVWQAGGAVVGGSGGTGGAAGGGSGSTSLLLGANVAQNLAKVVDILSGAEALADYESASLKRADLLEAMRLIQEARHTVALRPAEIRITTESGLGEKAAHYLWGILDDIDTVDDMVKEGPKADAAFRRMVMALAERRWAVASVNNSREPPVLEWREPPPEEKPKPS